jgi:8-oxo-dGTP pyrophosphatase MutT (NUDIX family)
VQPRIAAASLGFAEIPAGMLDGNSFKGTAAREIEEEAGLKVEESDLVNMTELALDNVTGGQKQRLKTKPVVFSEAVNYMNRVKVSTQYTCTLAHHPFADHRTGALRVPARDPTTIHEPPPLLPTPLQTQ